MLIEKNGNGHGMEEMGLISTKDAIKKSILFIIANSFDDDTRQATEEMNREREKAINMVIEEHKAIIKQITESEKKVIWESVIGYKESDYFNKEAVKDILNQSVVIENKAISPPTPEVVIEAKSKSEGEKVELEILPPRDQNEIATINTHLINMPELQRVDLVNMVDKSIFKIVMKEPIDLALKLRTLPQVVNATEVYESGQRKIAITLLAKSKLERNNNLMNEKVNEIFGKKKR